MNRKLLAAFLTAAMLLSAAIPVLAEDDRPLSEREDLQYVTTIFQHPPKDEEYWEREFELNKELPALEGEAPFIPASDPTPEDIEKWNQMAKEKLEEDKAWDEYRLQEEQERRSKMLGAVVGDQLHDVNIPETTFQGDYEEYEGIDGSVTRIYEDGSIETSYADGTWEGVDNQGNRAYEDQDGNRIVELLSGDKATIRDNGTIVLQQTDNSTVTYHPDGTASWTNATGLVVDYNEYGERTAIGFDGGDKIDLVYGQLPPGDSKIEGPNGAFIEWHNGQTSEMQNDGVSDVVVNGDGNYGFSIKGTDGSTGRLEIDREYDPRIDEQGTIDANKQTNGNSGTQYTSDTKYSISSLDGSAIEIVQDNNHSGNITVRMEDPDGNVHLDRSYENGFVEKSYESADGKVKYEYKLDENGINSYYEDENGRQQLAETVVNDDGTITIKIDGGKDARGELTFHKDGSISLDTENGTHITVDKDGNPLEIRSDDERYVFDENGELVEAEVTLDDGSVLKMDQDGTTLTKPDGTVMTIEQNEDGSMTATLPDGTQLEKTPGGDWQPANAPAEADTPADDGKTEEDGKDRPSGNPSGDMTIAAIAGTYVNSGGSGYIDIDENWKEVYKDIPADATVTVYDAGNDCINITVSVTGNSMPEPMPYDASTGTGRLEYKEEGIAPVIYTITFEEIGDGSYSMHIVTTWGDDTYLDFNGVRSAD